MTLQTFEAQESLVEVNMCTQKNIE